jgi:hypothetical protein
MAVIYLTRISALGKKMGEREIERRNYTCELGFETKEVVRIA